VIAYLVWPPGQDFLFHKAEALMASEEPHDWLLARREYLDPLESRFPNHPYRQTTNAWRDKILLSEADGRARMLDSPVHTPLTEPKRDSAGESQYVAFSAEARKAMQRGDDDSAAVAWDEMAKLVGESDPKERKWTLLARQRAADLRKGMAVRRAVVQQQLDRIDNASRAGRFGEAAQLREQLKDRYGKYLDVAELVNPPSATTPATPEPGATGAPTQPSPESPPSPPGSTVRP
jgi:serine/threonine-protein kinase